MNHIIIRLVCTHATAWIVATIIGLFLSADAGAQSTHVPYEELLRRSATISPLSHDLFGESVSLQDGTVSFSHADVDLRTNSELTVSFGRKTASSTQGMHEQFAILGYGWEPDVPYMMGTYDSRIGWNANGSAEHRCSSASLLPAQPYGPWPNFHTTIIVANRFWHGIQISLPKFGRQQMLAVNTAQTVPTDGKTYIGTTRENWRISCLPSLLNGEGEGFLVSLPNGFVYTFNWMAVRHAIDLTNGGCQGMDGDGNCSPSDSWHTLVPISDYFIYATKVQDRFGNEINYAYDPSNPQRLTQISSNDGVTLTFGYDSEGLLRSVTAGIRTWNYRYSSGRNPLGFRILTSVEQPDGSQWTFSGYPGSFPGAPHISTDSGMTVARFWSSACAMDPGMLRGNLAPLPEDLVTQTVTHPSGATGIFVYRPLFHGTNNTPGGCTWYGTPDDYSYGTFGIPSVRQVYSLYQKSISGGGLTPITWTYTYSPSWSFDPSYTSGGACGTPCPTTSTTRIDRNDGTWERIIYGNSYHLNEGQLLARSIGQGSATISSANYSYLTTSSGQAFPDDTGSIIRSNPYGYGNPFHYKNRPVHRESVQQQGFTFTRDVTTFDMFARPTRIVRWSSTN